MSPWTTSDRRLIQTRGGLSLRGRGVMSRAREMPPHCATSGGRPPSRSTVTCRPRRGRCSHSAEAAPALVMLACGPITLQLPHERSPSPPNTPILIPEEPQSPGHVEDGTIGDHAEPPPKKLICGRPLLSGGSALVGGSGGRSACSPTSMASRLVTTLMSRSILLRKPQ
jgi:hypothetical protein